MSFLLFIMLIYNHCKQCLIFELCVIRLLTLLFGFLGTASWQSIFIEFVIYDRSLKMHFDMSYGYTFRFIYF